MNRVVKPKNQRARRALKDKEAKLVENVKKQLVHKGLKTSDIVSKALRDLHCIKAPFSVRMNKRNKVKPFEDDTSINFLADKNDASLFVFGNHSKKRPHNLIFGSMFNHEWLSGSEWGINPDTFIDTTVFNTQRKTAAVLGSKPAMIFNGPLWDDDERYQRIKLQFTSHFRNNVTEKLNLAGLSRAMIFTAVDGKITFRHYAIQFKRSGSKTPRVELEEVGPRMDLTLRRTHEAPQEMQKAALKKPKQLQARNEKNVSTGSLGHKVGRIHMTRQNLSDGTLALKKMKGLRKSASDPADEDTDMQDVQQPKRKRAKNKHKTEVE